MKKLKRVMATTAIVMAVGATSLLPTQSFASETQTQAVPKAVQKSQAFDKKLEQKALNKYLDQKGRMRIQPHIPIVIKFDDGSKIKYELEEYTTPNAPKASVKNGVSSSDYQASAVKYKTYTVKKSYFYGVANFTVKLYTDVKHSGRYVYVQRKYDGFNGTYAKWWGNKTRTLDSTGYNSDYATTEAYGYYSLDAPGAGNYFNGSYRIRADIDPAGAVYLRVID
ncbi:hypothetical protein [Priestia megaterium]|uniref:hypothetical protein n=1 Tax=Priestia megaterium TaxID=1404 RepID=UPI000BFB78DE|nr:hypothetical protein [Priestia megaterium]PGO60742.1 hypothetical protein CN981_09395 [Priestia megaterium]